jgi:GT2 family glycosyltransferase
MVFLKNAEIQEKNNLSFMLAPIIVFIYNRPEHTQKTLSALSANFLAKESILYIYSDGPKQNASETEKQIILETRKIALSEKWCGEIQFIQSDYNKGLADSIITGVTDVVSKHGKVIVLEDDLVTSPYFLTYMNDALVLYADKSTVWHISGYMYPLSPQGLMDAFFWRTMDCWGWAT